MSYFALQTTADSLEATIRQNHLLNLNVPWANELTYPQYADLSLRNIPHSVADLLGVPLPHSAPLRPDVWGGEDMGAVQRVIVFLMDGMGYMHLQKAIREDDELRQIVHDLTQGQGFVPTTSIAPTTTAVALTTLWTGGAPAQTGMIGTSMYLREYWQLGNMLKFSPLIGNHAPNTFTDWGAIPPDFVGMRGFAEHLAEHKIPTYMVSEKSLWRSGLSHILHRGVHEGILHLGSHDFYLRLRDALLQTKGKRCYVGVYYPTVDSTAHFYGAHNAYTHHEIKENLRGLRDLLADPQIADGRSLMMITADHGHYDVDTPIDMNENTAGFAIRQKLLMGISMDARLAVLHVRDGERDAIKAIIDEQLSQTLTYIDSADAIAQGLFGSPERLYRETRFRLGDLILIPRLGAMLVDKTVIDLNLVSWHGGLSDWEMITPLIWRRF